MELVWKEIEAQRLVSLESFEVPVAGILPLPEGDALSEVLDCKAEVKIERVIVLKDEAELNGTVTISAAALDADGRAFCFESRAGFSHTANVQGADKGMNAEASARASSLQIHLAEEGPQFEATIGVSLLITSNEPLRVTAGVNGVGDLELKTAQYRSSEVIKLGSDTLRMREELAEPGVARVIGCEGLAAVRETICDRDGVSVSGVLTVTVMTEDGDGTISSLVRQIPFREKLNVAAMGQEAVCRAETLSLSIHALGEEFALLAMEAEIRFSVFAAETAEYTLPVDAFSPTVGFDCLCDNVKFLSSRPLPTAFTQLRESIELPAGSAEAARVIFPSAHAVITSTECGRDSVTISGVLETTVVYESSAGSMIKYREDIPFGVSLPKDTPCTFARAECGCSVQNAGNTENTVQLAYSLAFDVDLYEVTETSVAVGLAEKELPPAGGRLIVAFASEGESFFDIAKRYSVSGSSVAALNPEIKEPFREGDKLLIIG